MSRCDGVIRGVITVRPCVGALREAEVSKLVQESTHGMLPAASEDEMLRAIGSSKLP